MHLICSELVDDKLNNGKEKVTRFSNSYCIKLTGILFGRGGGRLSGNNTKKEGFHKGLSFPFFTLYYYPVFGKWENKGFFCVGN